MIDVPALLAGLEIHVDKRSGKRLWAKCPHPEHNEKEPSWYIWNDPGSQNHGKFRCYGCGWRGGPLVLIRDLLDCTLDEARDALEIGEYNVTYLDVQIELRDATVRESGAPRWVVFPERQEDWPTQAWRYLERRAIGIPMIRRWGLGVANKGPLAGRIWIPIRDQECQLVSWQARTYIGDKIRYMSPDHGSLPTLLGAEHWPEPEDRRVVVVVEGPFDALAVDRATRLPVAALIGSEPSGEQMSLLTSFPDVVVLTDSDPAGDKAAEALLGLGRWTRVHRVRLPDGQDPGGASDATLQEQLASWLDVSDLKPR